MNIIQSFQNLQINLQQVNLATIQTKESDDSSILDFVQFWLGMFCVLASTMMLTLTSKSFVEDLNFVATISLGSQCSLIAINILIITTHVTNIQDFYCFMVVLSCFFNTLTNILIMYKVTKRFEGDYERQFAFYCFVIIILLVGFPLVFLMTGNMDVFFGVFQTYFFAPYAQAITNVILDPHVLNRENLVRVIILWCLPIMCTHLIDFDQFPSKKYQPSIVYIIFPIYFGLGVQINIIQICFARQNRGQLNNQAPINGDQHSIVSDIYNKVTNSEDQYSFSKRISNEFLAKPIDDYVCVICFVNLKENPNETESQNSHSEKKYFGNCIASPCNHYFHKECFKSWMHIKTQCPTCRKDLTRFKKLVKYQK